MKTIAIFLLVVTASLAVAADPPVKVDARPVESGETVAPARELSPMMLEIQAAMESASLRVAELKRRHDAAISDDEAMALAREAAKVKRESRIEMMRIQLRYARQDGNTELVAELEDIVTRMEAPPAKGVPMVREDHK
ncbi:MAG: hypothetical protein ABFS42_04320 [Candidatus Krumholzibacteriota bacterium]